MNKMRRNTGPVQNDHQIFDFKNVYLTSKIFGAAGGIKIKIKFYFFLHFRQFPGRRAQRIKKICNFILFHVRLFSLEEGP